MEEQNNPVDQKPTTPAPTPMQVILDSGGMKGIALKFVMYFLLPLLTIIGLGYFGYDTFQKRKFSVQTTKSGNESDKYEDDSVEIQIKVESLKPSVKQDSDVDNFKKVQMKIKQKYGI